MGIRTLVITSCFAFLACNTAINQDVIEKEGNTLNTRFAPPPAYERVKIEDSTFAFYLRNLKLKPHGSKVLLYNGKFKNRQDVHSAIIDMSIGKKDLQQCADAIMRLRAEYLYGKKQFDKIQFNFTSGHTLKFIDWAEGIRPIINGNKVAFAKKAGKDYSYPNFLKYMETIFMYCGSYSLERELVAVKGIGNLKAGDIFIRGGFPGHAVIVLDVAKNKENGEKVFLLGQSYMPAQEIHILKNFNNENLSPWYSENFGEILSTPEWDFPKNSLMRFPGE